MLFHCNNGCTNTPQCNVVKYSYNARLVGSTHAHTYRKRLKWDPYESIHFLCACYHVLVHPTQSDDFESLNSASNVLPQFIQSVNIGFLTPVIKPTARYRSWSRSSAQRDLLLTHTGVDDGQLGLQRLWPILNKILQQVRRNLLENYCNKRVWNRLLAFVYFIVSNGNGIIWPMSKN